MLFDLSIRDKDLKMDHKDRLSSAESWKRFSFSGCEVSNDVPSNVSSFTHIETEQHQQKWEDTSILDYGIRIEPHLQEFNPPSESQSALSYNQVQTANKVDDQMIDTVQINKCQDWDPRAMLNNLSFLEDKIHQLQELVHLIVGRRGQVMGRPDELVTQQQQLITADLTSIIVQLISTAGTLLPSVKHNLSAIGQLGQLDGFVIPSSTGHNEQDTQIDRTGINGVGQKYPFEEHELKDEEDADESENLPPGSYEILQLEKEEILAPHTHFCTICGKGFKRDANLRMHMRGHGDEYKTPAALAKPTKELSSEPMLIKRYSCPYTGCKRNKEHKKFQPLKTILCVKNHYKRTHCDKSYICSKCNTKKFSVMADLKTHEKHCGKDKWLCSCGTTFSRKDKLFGHIALFQGHTPAIPLDDSKVTHGASDQMGGNEGANNFGSINFNFASTTPSGGNGVVNVVDVKEGADDSISYYSPLNFDTCNFGGFHEFPRPTFEDSESSFSFLIAGSSNYSQKSGAESNSNNF